MEDVVIMQLFAVIVVIFIIILAATSLGTKFLPFGANYNNLCENRWTSALEPGLNNRLEGEVFLAFMTDCCYNIDMLDGSENDICHRYVNAVNPPEDPDIVCADKSSRNPRNYFHCEQSTHLTGDLDCNEEDCIENCNLDDICEDDQGEFALCYDCW